jgi:nucleoside 2-deoxyribosyltransferase
MTKTIKKLFVFVLIPRHSDFDAVYKTGIKSACFAVSADCERVDDQIFIEKKLDQFKKQIAKADIVISDMTGCNPDVFYETGYAHALKKQVILLAQNENDIPFDLKYYPHIIYNENLLQLKAELEKRLTWHDSMQFL